MNRTEVIRSLADKADLTLVKAEEVVSSLLEVFEEAFEQGEKIVFIGFGTFSPRVSKQRVGFNPSSRGQIIIPEATKVSFRAGKKLSSAMNANIDTIKAKIAQEKQNKKKQKSSTPPTTKTTKKTTTKK